MLGGFSLLQYVGITTSGQSYVGTWGLSDPALGSSIVRIAKAGGDTYTLTGARALGAGATTGRVSDDQLVANGSVNGVTWQLSLSFADREQLHATITYGDGRPPVETLLTRPMSAAQRGLDTRRPAVTATWSDRGPAAFL